MSDLILPDNVFEPDLIWLFRDLPAWNMDTVASVNISVASTLSRVRLVSAMIYQDGNTNLKELTQAGNILVTSTQVTLTRDAGGIFDSVLYDDAVLSRGYLLIGRTPV